jgi:dTDP-4-amino-4,6-dideoxygalactose transaminase
MIHYPVPPHLQKAYKHLGYKQGDFPIAEEIARTCLSLPVWPGIQREVIKKL